MTKTQSNLQANSTNFVHIERDFLDEFDTQPLTPKIRSRQYYEFKIRRGAANRSPNNPTHGESKRKLSMSNDNHAYSCSAVVHGPVFVKSYAYVP